MTGVFLAASNPEKLRGTSPTPPHCLASSLLCLGRKVFGWQSLDLTMNWATSVGWLRLEVQAEEVDHCLEQQIHGHGHEDYMGPLEARGCLEVRDNQPSLEVLAGPEHHRRQWAPCVLAFRNTQEDL